MPVLPLEPFVFPNDLLEETAFFPSESHSWWVLHTKPRAEKALARRLLHDDISFFLPLSPRTGRVVISHLPLFPGYVFLHGDGDDRVRALESTLIARCLRVTDGSRLRTDLARVYRMMQAEEPLHSESRMVAGTLVKIVDGPLAGLTGKILRRGKQLRFFVEVDLVQRGISGELDHWMFQPVA